MQQQHAPPRRWSQRDLVRLVAREAGQPQKVTDQVVSAMMDVIVQQVTAGDSVSLTNFASFEPVDRPPTERYAPHLGHTVTRPARREMRVRVSRRVRTIVRTGDPGASRRKTSWRTWNRRSGGDSE